MTGSHPETNNHIEGMSSPQILIPPRPIAVEGFGTSWCGGPYIPATIPSWAVWLLLLLPCAICPPCAEDLTTQRSGRLVVRTCNDKRKGKKDKKSSVR